MSEVLTIDPQPVLRIESDTMVACLCSWCRERVQLLSLYSQEGYAVTHGICPYHEKVERDKMAIFRR